MELFVSTLKNVDLRVEKLWVPIHVEASIDFSEGRIHLRASLLTEFAMENDDVIHQSFYSFFITQEEVFHLRWIIEIDGASNMSALKFIIKAAIDDQVRFSVKVRVL